MIDTLYLDALCDDNEIISEVAYKVKLHHDLYLKSHIDLDELHGVIDAATRKINNVSLDSSSIQKATDYFQSIRITTKEGITCQ